MLWWQATETINLSPKKKGQERKVIFIKGYGVVYSTCEKWLRWEKKPVVSRIQAAGKCVHSIIRGNKLCSTQESKSDRAQGFPGGSVVKNPAANAGDSRDAGSIPGSGRSPGKESGNPLQYSCLGNSMDRGPWQAIVHGVAKNQTRLKRLNNKYCQILTSIYEHIYNFLATLHGWWDLSSPARDRTWVHGSESPSFNHWTTRKSPVWFC